MSNLDDPRVLFAAERTLMAWSRTSAGLMAFGFLVDRTAVLLPGSAPRAGLPFWIGLGFILLGVALCALSVMQYRKAVASLRPIEIPPGYWVNLAAYTSGAIGLLGVLLALYLVVG